MCYNNAVRLLKIVISMTGLCLAFMYILFEGRLVMNQNGNYRSVLPSENSTTTIGVVKTGAQIVRSIKEDDSMELILLDKCKLKSGELSKTPRPVTALASYPCSGNTWLRHLIQQMTGIATSSVYCDTSLQRNGFPYECTKERHKVAVVKTHRMKQDGFDKAVLLIRNPYDALLSYYNYKKSKSHTGLAKNTLLKANSSAWIQHIAKNLNIWINFNKKWLDFPGPVHIIKYENLKSNLFKELQDLASFLGTNVTTFDVQCTVRLQEGKFHRKIGSAERENLIKLLYSNTTRAKINLAVKDLDNKMKPRFQNND